MLTHYGKFLCDVGKSVLYKSEDIELLLNKRERLKKELEEVEIKIDSLEQDF